MDVLGRVVAVVVLATPTPDHAAGVVPLDQAAGHTGTTVRDARADRCFRNQVVMHGGGLGVDVEIAERDPQVKGLVPQPKRWRAEQPYGDSDTAPAPGP